MIFVLLAALAVGVACYFGIDALGTAAIDRWYLSDDAIAARNLEHERSLQEYVSARGVSSRDTLAIEQWSRGEKKANVIVYQAEGDPYEAGSWGTSELLDDTSQSDIADLGYSFFTLQFADGEYRVAVCDYSEAWLYSYVRFGALVLGFVIYSFIAFGFTRRLTRRVTRLSEAVGAAGALNRTIPVVGTDEIARLASLAVCARENEDWDALREKAAALKDSLGATVELVQGDSLTISSTELRQGGALRCYTPESVADYLEEKHLYGY